MTQERNLDLGKPQTGGRLAGLDFIRAAACIGVLLFHMHLTLTGFISVTLFFAISGFLMTYNALDRNDEDPPTLKGSISFALSRTKKLYKLYLITLIIPLLGQLYGVVSGLEKFDGMFVFRIASNILLLQSLVPDLNISLFLNGVAWYLSTSLFLYMAFPYIINRLRKRQSSAEAWAVIVTAFIAQAVLAYAVDALGRRYLPPDYFYGANVTQWFAYASPFSRIADFIIACNFAYLFKNRKQTARSAGMATLAEIGAILFALAVQLLFKKNLLPPTTIYCTAFIPAAHLLIWEFARGEGYVSRAVDNSVTRFISSLSSYVFLIHYIVIVVLTPAINMLPVSLGVRRGLYLVLIPAASFILSALYKAAESRAKAKKRSLPA